MCRLLPFLVGFALLVVPALAQAQYYISTPARSGTFQTSSVNQLYDDGLHGDGAAGDGIMGADIALDQPAGQYYWYVSHPDVDGWLWGIYPSCGTCGNDPATPTLWSSGPGDVVHFTLDVRSLPGWGPQPSVACDHCIPAYLTLEVAVDFIPSQTGGTGYPANRNGTVWERVATIPNAGTHTFGFKTSPDVMFLTRTYNTFCYMWCEPPPMTFVTTEPNMDVRFKFDETTGRMQAVVLGVTPAHATSWGELKILYR